MAGDVDLLDLLRGTGRVDELPRVAPRRVERLARARRIPDAGVQALDLGSVEVVLQQTVQRPDLVQLPFRAEQEIRLAAGAWRLAQRDLLVLEIKELSDCDAQPFGAGARVEEARRQRQRELVGVAHAVVAEVTVSVNSDEKLKSSSAESNTGNWLWFLNGM